MSDRRTAALLLCVQAVLLFTALDLLPVWTDELFTLHTVAKPVPQIIEAVRRDIHPPLYYLLAHAWPWHGIAGLRALSALWALTAAAALWVFWRDRAPRLALALFALSPCLLLYGRMARSYAMQTALAVVAIAMLERWMRDRQALRWAAGALAAVVALLYTHYVPGVAILAGFVLVGWRAVGVGRAAAFAAIAAAAYAPWAALSIDALRRWGGQASYSATYALSGNAAIENLLKMAFGATSLTVGESVLPLSLLLVPVVLWLAAAGLRAKLFPAPMVGAAAAIGYVGVARWVSYAFIPARLLWLLPFLCLAVAAGIGRRRYLGAVILLSYLISTVLYFRRDHFLNLGYVAPLPEIVATLNRDAQPNDVILLDPYNTDYQVILAGLSGRVPYVVLDGRSPVPAASTVWIVRNTNDASPGHTTSAAEAAACDGRPRRDTLLDPYAPWQRVVLRTMGRPLTHFYRLTACGASAK